MNLIGRANRQVVEPSPLFEEETDLTIKGLAGFHIETLMPHIILNVEFPDDIMKEYNLTDVSIFASYDSHGMFLQAYLADEGVFSSLLLTEEEHQAIELYIHKHGLVNQLFEYMQEKESEGAIQLG